MKAPIVYESMFGNTDPVAAGLGPGAEVEIRPVHAEGALDRARAWGEALRSDHPGR